MPGMTSTTTLPPFSAALTPEMVEHSNTSYPASYITSNLLTLAGHLIDLTSNSMLFGKPNAPEAFTPSLSTLHARLRAGYFGPSYLPPQILKAAHIQDRIAARFEGDVTQRGLADFEDLYYAVLATLKEIAGYLHDHVRSGFHSASSTVCDGGDTIAELHAGLSTYWTLLNNPACGKALDDAVRQARFEALREEIFSRVESGDMERCDAEGQLEALRALRMENSIDGMVFISGWSPGMISVTLQQRYVQVFGLERAIAQDEAMRERRAKKMEAAPKKVHKKTLSRLEGVRARRSRSSVQHTRTHSRNYSLGEIGSFATSGQVKDAGVHHRSVVDGPLITDAADDAAHFALDRQLREMDTGDERTSEARRHHSLEWDMKKLRVDEYQTHLRSRVGMDACPEN